MNRWPWQMELKTIFPSATHPFSSNSPITKATCGATVFNSPRRSQSRSYRGNALAPARKAQLWSHKSSRVPGVSVERFGRVLQWVARGNRKEFFGRGGGSPLPGVPIPEGNWYPVVVEVVYVVPGSIPERVQYANMDDWRMDCPW